MLPADRSNDYPISKAELDEFGMKTVHIGRHGDHFTVVQDPDGRSITVREVIAMIVLLERSIMLDRKALNDRLEDMGSTLRSMVGLNTKAGFVYLAQDGVSERYKIGFSTNLAHRIKALRCANPDIHFIYAIHGSVVLETMFHHIFRESRFQGEWFHLSAEELEFFQRYGSNALSLT